MWGIFCKPNSAGASPETPTSHAVLPLDVPGPARLCRGDLSRRRSSPMSRPLGVPRRVSWWRSHDRGEVAV